MHGWPGKVTAFVVARYGFVIPVHACVSLFALGWKEKARDGNRMRETERKREREREREEREKERERER